MSPVDSLQKHSDVVADIVAKVPTQLIIGGAEVPASDGATFDVLDPATAGILATVASGSVDDDLACVDAASAAAQAWAQTAPRKRSEILQRTYLVFADADLDAATAGAMIAKMRNGGEACTAANRFFVESGIAEAFSARLTTAMGALTVGPRSDASVNVAPAAPFGGVKESGLGREGGVEGLLAVTESKYIAVNW